MKASDTWNQSHLSTVLSCYATTTDNDDNFKVLEFTSLVTTTEPVMTPLLGLVRIRGPTDITGHSKRIHVVLETPDQPFSDNVVKTCIYGDIKPGSSRVLVCL